MAVYFLNMKTFGRAGGSSAASAAAYRAGERIRDERTGKTYDHSERQDVMHKEIVLPSRFADEEMAWARDRASLWNAAESAATREVKVEGLGAKTTLEMRDGNRRELGLPPVIDELLHVRERWAAVTNEALQQAHQAARIDHRSLDAQGIDREPRP